MRDADSPTEKLRSDRQFANNLSRGLEVLRAFTAAEPVLTNRAISDRTGLPKPTVSRLTYTLSLLGYLRSDERGAFRLGTAVLSLAHPLLSSLEVRQVARPVLQALANDTQCTANLGMLERNEVIYIDTIRTDVGNPYLPDVGRLSPLLHSTIGRALVLAHKGEDRVRLLNRLKVADPLRHDEGIALLQEDESLMLQEGFCQSRGSWLPTIDAIAVPLALPKAIGPAAINLTRLNDDCQRPELAQFAPMIRAAAGKIASLMQAALSSARG
jgi:DNA-binding IclR family transcriptional regulator